MKKLAAALLAALLLPQAYALDSTAAVKASTVLKTQNSWDGKPLVYPQGQAQVTGMLIEIAPGAETGWHLHTVPSFAMVTEGELEVHLKDGSVKRLKAGDMLAEVVNTLHNGHNVGTGPVKLVVVYTGAADSTLTVMEPKKP
jgi:quercetin dioxygenase-like cupin family protein